jgi:hypothetical protein
VQRILSLDRSPPFDAVQRYFFSTPLFVLLAGVLLAWQGEAAFQSRWSPVTLALTHLFTLGALGMSMVGALIQLLPVVAGCTLPRVRSMAGAVHALLAAGSLALAAAFLLAWPWMFILAASLLAPALLGLVACLAIGLWQVPPPGAAAMIATVRLALASLLVTAALGALLAASFAWPGAATMPLLRLTDLHALWGLCGWAGLLLVGVAFQVLPMFQVTPLYHGAMERWLGLSVVLALMVYSVDATLESAHGTPLGAAPALLLAMVAACFGIATLRLLARRTRAPDVMTRFWRFAMACLLAAIGIGAAPAELAGSGQTLAPGVLLVVGFLYSTVNGMLYKIIPFLLWHREQARAQRGQRVLQVKHIVDEATARRQFRLHALAVGTMTAACWYPAALGRIAGMSLLASAIALTWILWRAARRDLLLPSSREANANGRELGSAA